MANSRGVSSKRSGDKNLDELAKEIPRAFWNVIQKAESPLQDHLLNTFKKNNQTWYNLHIETPGVVNPTHDGGYVYLAASDDGRIKIGRSVRPKQRVSSLQTGNPESVDLYIAVGVDEPGSVEKSLHDSYEARKTSGEWFELTWSDVQKIEDKLLSEAV